ncbi:hypothetical protein SAMN04488593_2205 [Microbacterium azadirachtae]|nr:hypothetical protein SAMN04488593_2205 [Microbacterium azadirachtae]SEG14853.1 hypothetical protein SAMN04488594_1974 [Microbacterium azadirachtae]SEG17407.1 hypothetical protein SAMN04488592_1984 [Microbacterium azadirachtae]
MDRVIEQIVTRPRPVWLTEKEVDLEHDPAVVPETPARATAFVRFHEAVVQPDVEVTAWNEHAVRIRFTSRDGQTHEGWVWKDAVRTRPRRSIPPRR